MAKNQVIEEHEENLPTGVEYEEADGVSTDDIVADVVQGITKTA